nr:formaldehyde-activating enzyme [Propioniciclava coleopterorum]
MGAAQAGVAVGVHQAMAEGILPPDAPQEWAVVAAVWVNPACDDLDEVYRNQRDAAHGAIVAAIRGLPTWDEVDQAALAPSNPFYTPKAI